LIQIDIENLKKTRDLHPKDFCSTERVCRDKSRTARARVYSGYKIGVSMGEDTMADPEESQIIAIDGAEDGLDMSNAKIRLDNSLLGGKSTIGNIYRTRVASAKNSNLFY
jgi:hypothetical protein